jgi:N6-adenosine-specific RNA methylase IME4
MISVSKPEAGFQTIYADPPWRYMGGVVKPEGGQTGLHQPTPSQALYKTLSLKEITALPVPEYAAEDCHLYLWTPNSLLPAALTLMSAWGFTYKSNVVWVKRRKDGGVYGGNLGNYLRNATELCLFGIKGKAKFGPATHGRHNVIETLRLEHSRKPDGVYDLIEEVSPGPYLELFARRSRNGWTAWGDQL